MLASALLVSACTAVTAAAPRPNIIWVMADDLGWGEVGVFPCTSEHGRIATPHLDQMAAEGMKFTDAYAGYTVCAPSRTTFFTGRHSGNFPKYNLAGTDLPAAQGVTTTAMLLKKAGYVTAASGKIAPLDSPAMQGFDDFLGQVSQVDAHNMYPAQIDVQTPSENVTKLQLPLNAKAKSRELCMASPAQYNYTTDVFQDNALTWLEKVAGKDDPFFLYLAFTVPHAGGWSDTGKESGAPVPTDLQYANETSWPDVEKDHAADITYLDRHVGDLFAKVKALGVDDNTIIFFASDNGAHLEGGHKVTFFNSTGGLAGHKRSLYEGGMRSPTIVRWPGVVPAGHTSTTQWAFWDVMPTFAELAGVDASELPENIDGISIVDTLRSGTQNVTHDYLFFTWDGAGEGVEVAEGAKSSGYAVRMGNWKAVVPFCADTVNNKPSTKDATSLQLYDLTSDPFEMTDVSAHNTAVVSSIITFILTKDLSCTCFQC